MWDIHPVHTSTPIGCIVRAFQNQVIQAQPFRALAELRYSLSSAEYDMSIAEGHHTYDEHNFLSDFQLDCECTLLELRTALRTSPKRTSPGSDHVTYAAFSNLRSSTTKVPLQLCNSLRRTEFLPQIWTVAHFIPLLNPVKSPTSVYSFRPVSLTSCAGK